MMHEILYLVMQCMIRIDFPFNFFLNYITLLHEIQITGLYTYILCVHIAVSVASMLVNQFLYCEVLLFQLLFFRILDAKNRGTE